MSEIKSKTFVSRLTFILPTRRSITNQVKQTCQPASQPRVWSDTALEWTDARLQWEPINQSHSESGPVLPETDQGIWSSSQQINTAPQPKAGIMTIITLTSLCLPHGESVKPMRSWDWQSTAATLSWKNITVTVRHTPGLHVLGWMSCSKIQQLLCRKHLALRGLRKAKTLTHH